MRARMLSKCFFSLVLCAASVSHAQDRPSEALDLGACASQFQAISGPLARCEQHPGCNYYARSRPSCAAVNQFIQKLEAASKGATITNRLIFDVAIPDEMPSEQLKRYIEAARRAAEIAPDDIGFAAKRITPPIPKSDYYAEGRFVYGTTMQGPGARITRNGDVELGFFGSGSSLAQLKGPGAILLKSGVLMAGWYDGKNGLNGYGVILYPNQDYTDGIFDKGVPIGKIILFLKETGKEHACVVTPEGRKVGECDPIKETPENIRLARGTNITTAVKQPRQIGLGATIEQK